MGSNPQLEGAFLRLLPSPGLPGWHRDRSAPVRSCTSTPQQHRDSAAISPLLTGAASSNPLLKLLSSVSHGQMTAGRSLAPAFASPMSGTRSKRPIISLDNTNQ